MMYKKFAELVYHKQSLRKVIFSINSADITCFHMPSHYFITQNKSIFTYLHVQYSL